MKKIWTDFFKGPQSWHWNTYFLKQWTKFPFIGNVFFSSHSETEKICIKWEMRDSLIFLNNSIMQYLGNVIFQHRLVTGYIKQTYTNLIAWHQTFQNVKNCLNHHIILKSYFKLFTQCYFYFLEVDCSI